MKLDAIGIISKNLAQSVQFYSLLGLKFPDFKEGEDHIEAQTESGVRIMLDSLELVKKFKPDWVRPIHQAMGMAFLCESPLEVDKMYKKIIAEGYLSATEPWDAFWGQRYASVLDPDGNSVDLFAPL